MVHNFYNSYFLEPGTFKFLGSDSQLCRKLWKRKQKWMQNIEFWTNFFPVNSFCRFECVFDEYQVSFYFESSSARVYVKTQHPTKLSWVSLLQALHMPVEHWDGTGSCISPLLQQHSQHMLLKNVGQHSLLTAHLSKLCAHSLFKECSLGLESWLSG